MSQFKGKVAIVTGGAQGIGKKITEIFLKRGMKVVMAEIDEEAGLETREEFKSLGEIQFIATDVAHELAVRDMVQRTFDWYKQIDILVNNAARMPFKTLSEMEYEEWRRTIEVNLGGVFLCSRYAAPYLKKTKGSIINLCSTRAFMSEPGSVAYSASKGGVYALTHQMAVELGPDIRVNAISPGWIEVSDLQKSANRKQPELSKKDHEQHPAGRVGKAEDIANMALFLADPQNGFITGANFIVDGGMTRKMIYAE